IWRPAARLVRFVIVCHPQRGTIFLLSTDLTLAPLEILMLYGYRFRIELGFRQAVHVLGAYAYHFWMCGMKPLKRGDGDQYLHRTSDASRAAIRRKMAAFHIHVQRGCIAQGLLQHLSLNSTAEVWLCFRSWLRTMNPALPPSELVAANALRAAIPGFFSSSLLDPKLKKILDQYERFDIHLDSQEIAAWWNTANSALSRTLELIRKLRKECSAGLQTGCTGGVHAARRRRIPFTGTLHAR